MVGVDVSGLQMDPWDKSAVLVWGLSAILYCSTSDELGELRNDFITTTAPQTLSFISYKNYSLQKLYQ